MMNVDVATPGGDCWIICYWSN